MYKPKQLSALWVITKNNEIVTDDEIGQKNGFHFESQAWQAIEDIKPQFKTIIIAKTEKLK